MLYGKQGHLLQAMNQPWGSKEHLYSMCGVAMSQQQSLLCPLWWPDRWVAWSKNMAASPPMSCLVDSGAGTLQ